MKLYSLNECIQWWNPDSRHTSGAALKPDSPPLFLFSPLWCDASLTRCPPCQHQPTLARPMTRLQGAHAPQPFLGGWTQQPGRLPRVLPSAEAKSSRRDFAAEVERNESGGRARCWEMEAELLPPHPSKAWCSLPAMTSRQRRLAGLGVVLLSVLQPAWSVQVVKGTSTRRRWCRLELLRLAQWQHDSFCGYVIQWSSCGRHGGKSWVLLSLWRQSAAPR